MQKQKSYPFEANIDVSDLPSHLEYFLVLPFSHQQARNPKNWNTVPAVLTFDDENIKIVELINDYKEMRGEFSNQFMYFTYSDGYIVNEDQSVILMKKKLARPTLKGLVLFTKVNLSAKKVSPKVYNSSEIYQDQNSMLDYLLGQSQFGNQKTLAFVVQIPRNFFFKEVITIKIDGDKKGKDLLQHIFSEMKKIFGVNLTENDIASLSIKQTGVNVDRLEMLIRQKIYHKSKLVLRLQNNIQLKRLASKHFHNSIVIYKFGGKESKTFKYSDIADLTFFQLYTAHLQEEQAKHGKQMQYALQIMDTIIKPEQKLSLASPYFQIKESDPINLVGLVITQKMVFYHTIPGLVERIDLFTLDEFIEIPPQQQQTRKSLRKMSIEKAKKTSNQYFRANERLQTILIYTSQLKFFEDKQKTKLVKIYESLNKFLRDTHVLTLNLQQLKSQWRYLYSSALLTHLKNVENYKGKAYRGIGYNPKLKKGKIVTFKQFISTSISRSVAVSFASDNHNTTKYLLQLQIEEAKKINEFSKIMAEEEVLIEPFSQFQVVEVKKQQIEATLVNKPKKCSFKIFVLRQIFTQTALPSIRATFIIWIDNKTQQGHKVFNQIPQTKQTVALIQILSTAELQSWLAKNSFFFANPTANLIFISNMTRKQGNAYNELAGVEGLRVIRKYDEKIPVFFYVGDLKKAKEKLQKQNMNQNVILGNDPKQLCAHIMKKIK